MWQIKSQIYDNFFLLVTFSIFYFHPDCIFAQTFRRHLLSTAYVCGQVLAKV